MKTENCKAVAIKKVYSRNWRAGEAPTSTELGELFFEPSANVESVFLMISEKFREANAFRLFDERGELFCAGTL
jgi:hypothetical protein